jgi:hypothetical protein
LRTAIRREAPTSSGGRVNSRWNVQRDDRNRLAATLNVGNNAPLVAEGVAEDEARQSHRKKWKVKGGVKSEK